MRSQSEINAKPVVWATRPAAQNQSWCEQLTAAGFAAINSPLMAIEPVQDPAAVQSVKDAMMALDEFDYLIFVSQNAVVHGVEWINTYWPQWPVRQQYFAIGSKTAELLSQSVAEVAAPLSGMDTQALLALPELADVWGKKILILRGRGGLPRLGDALQQAGAVVRYCELYERVALAPQGDVLAELQHRAREAASGVAPSLLVTLFSGETLDNLSDCIRSGALPPQGMVVLVPGTRVATMATDFASDGKGFAEVISAPNASATAMFNALQNWCAAGTQ